IRERREEKRRQQRQERYDQCLLEYRERLLELVDELSLVTDEEFESGEVDSEAYYAQLEELGITRATMNTPGELYMINRQVIDGRHYLDEDDPLVKSLFDYVLARACAKTGVEVVLHSLMRNHLHMFLLDRLGRISQFLQYFF